MRICNCWDDGNVDDIRVMEILRRHGATGSFNLNAASHHEARRQTSTYKQVKPVWKLARGEIADVYRGFLVANHTLTHPHLTKLTDDQVAYELREGRAALERLVGYPVLGFAYPFGNHDARVMELVRAAGHVYARTCITTEAVMPPADPMAFHSSCHHQAPDFWERFERAKAADGVFYFWGHSYEFIDEATWQIFEDKVARISADPAARWVNLPDLFVPAHAA